MRLITDRAGLRAATAALIGRWIGEGHGDYPTLDAFDYREELRVEGRPGDDTLRYDQRAWRHEGGAEVASHWEVGLIRLGDDGTITVLDAQNGRTEVLTGWVLETDEGVELELRALVHAHDERMRAATRRLVLAGDHLSYEMSMATTRVPELRLHLRAELERDGEVDT